MKLSRVPTWYDWERDSWRIEMPALQVRNNMHKICGGYNHVLGLVCLEPAMHRGSHSWAK